MVWEKNIWNEINRMQTQIDRLFQSSFPFDRTEKYDSSEDFFQEYRKALTDFKENDKEYTIQIEIPGVDKEDIELNVRDSKIEVKAEKKQEKEKGTKNKGNYRYERSYAGFYQTFEVPENANLEDLEASYKNGVLTIKIPKKNIEKKKKVIKIK